MVAERGEVGLPRVAESAADDDAHRSRHAHHRGEGAREGRHALVEDLAGERVVLDFLENTAGTPGDVEARGARGVPAGQRGCRYDRLEADLEAGAGVTDQCQPDFPRVASACVGRAPQDESRGHARSDRDVQVVRCARPEARFGERSGAHVVPEGHGETDGFLEEISHRSVEPAEIDREHANPSVRVDDSGHDDADFGDEVGFVTRGVLAQDRLAKQAHLSCDDRDEFGDTTRGGDLASVRQGAARGHHAHLERGPSDVDRDRAHVVKPFRRAG